MLKNQLPSFWSFESATPRRPTSAADILEDFRSEVRIDALVPLGLGGFTTFRGVPKSPVVEFYGSLTALLPLEIQARQTRREETIRTPERVDPGPRWPLRHLDEEIAEMSPTEAIREPAKLLVRRLHGLVKKHYLHIVLRPRIEGHDDRLDILWIDFKDKSMFGFSFYVDEPMAMFTVRGTEHVFDESPSDLAIVKGLSWISGA